MADIIYKGEVVSLVTGEGIAFLSFPGCIVTLPVDLFVKVADELDAALDEYYQKPSGQMPPEEPELEVK